MGMEWMDVTLGDDPTDPNSHTRWSADWVRIPLYGDLVEGVDFGFSSFYPNVSIGNPFDYDPCNAEGGYCSQKDFWYLYPLGEKDRVIWHCQNLPQYAWRWTPEEVELSGVEYLTSLSTNFIGSTGVIREYEVLYLKLGGNPNVEGDWATAYSEIVPYDPLNPINE